jgi:leader peptidase (prepilin peptidase)/N-methyltransferase
VTLQTQAPWLLAVFAALFGLVLGSFINVVIHRLPLGESIVSPRSRCPGCKNLVAAYDNVPVLSYIALRGRCRHCGAPISLRYPAIELAVGAAAVATFVRHGASLELVVELAFVVAMIALIFIDYDHQILPDSITLSGLVLGLVLAWPRDAISVIDAVKGAALGGGLLFAVSEVYLRVKNVEGMGFGDVKMMAMVGAFVGWKGVLLTLFLGSFVGSVVGVIVIAMSGGDMKTKLPFGTFLGMGAIATIYAGPPVITWYSGLFQ